MLIAFITLVLPTNLQALAVVIVGLGAGSTRSAGSSASVALTAALSPPGHSSTASRRSSRGRCRLDSGGHSGGLSGGRSGCSGLLDRSGAAAGAGAGVTTSPNGRAGHGESLASVVDAEVGIGVGGLVGAGEL